MIKVKDLVKRYGTHTAVDHLSFTVEQGQIYGFLGPNGAGKSTTMNMITGYLAFDDGEIWIDGHNILDEPEKVKKNIGYLPEIPPLYFDMTVNEYLEFAADLKKIPKNQKKEQISKVADQVKIEDVRHRLIRNLSKGYRQRVGLAQAILGDPKIIILDEPTVGLDPKQIIEIRELIRNLGKEHTVILSSHILSEVSAVCDSILILNHGKLAASGTPEELRKDALNTNTLELTVKGEKEAIEAAIRLISEAEHMSIQESEEEGCVDIIIKTKRDVDIREKIFYKMAELGTPILNMQLTALSLEDVFLELTEDEKKDPEPEKEELEEVKENESNI